jgi:hypothetical protein
MFSGIITGVFQLNKLNEGRFRDKNTVSAAVAAVAVAVCTLH